MAELVFIVGRSGSGKSTSICPVEEGEVKIQGLDPNTTVILNADQKMLPSSRARDFYKEGVNYHEDVDNTNVMNYLKKINEEPHIKSVVLDTWSRLASNTVDSPAFAKKQGFQKWMDFGVDNITLFNAVNNRMRKDVIVYMMAHPSEYIDEFGYLTFKIHAQGNMLKDRIPESYSTIVLYTQKVKIPGKDDQYTFRVNNFATAKSPLGMFPEINMPNDLGLVDGYIRKAVGI